MFNDWILVRNPVFFMFLCFAQLFELIKAVEGFAWAKVVGVELGKGGENGVLLGSGWGFAAGVGVEDVKLGALVAGLVFE